MKNLTLKLKERWDSKCINYDTLDKFSELEKNCFKTGQDICNGEVFYDESTSGLICYSHNGNGQHGIKLFE